MLVLAQDEVTAANVYGYYSGWDENYRSFGDVIEKPRAVNDRADALEYENESIRE